MLDRQIRKKTPEPIIPVVSPVLHFISLTVAVFLRWRFGYSYLQPIASFIIFAWSILLFGSVTWLSRFENLLWYRTKWLCLFLLSSVVMFFIHFLIAYFSVYLRKGKHDHDCGTCWLGGNDDKSTFSITQICVEPVTVFLTGAMLYYAGDETLLLGIWLFVAAIAMSIKECMNFFHFERKLHASKDSMEEAQQTIYQTGNHRKAPLRSKKRFSRKEKKPNQPKQIPTTDDAATAIHHADMLGLEPPYTFQTAQKAYRKKLKELHPDSNSPDESDLPEDAPQFSALRSALDFFKTYNTQT